MSQTTLPELERELEATLSRYAELRAVRPNELDVLRRAELGAELDDLIERAAELQAAIAREPARDAAGVAVKLRRLAASVDFEGFEKLLLASAIAGVEGAATVSSTLDS